MKKQKNWKYRILAMLLCLSMMLVGVPITAVAEGSAAAEEMDPTVTDGSGGAPEGQPITAGAEEMTDALEELRRLEPGDVPLEQLSSMPVLTAAALPEFIRAEGAAEKQHVNRVEEQETNLSTVIFQNKDGTKTSYIFAAPVKYFALDGSVRDKSTALTTGVPGYAYSMLDNSVRVGFPRVISTGVRLQYEDYQLELVPVGDGTATAVYSESEGTVLYANVFGRGTALTYRPTLSGMKEDIVLLKRGVGNTFSFVMTPEDLEPVLENGRWVLKNDADETVGTIGAIEISDSAGHTAVGSMSVTAAGAGEYNVTVTAPEDFLADAETVYPVYVDPTVTFEETGYYYGENDWVTEYEPIRDTGVYGTQTLANNAPSNYTYHILNSTSTGGRVIYKLYDFFGEYGSYKAIDPYRIGSAQLHVYVWQGVGDYNFHIDSMTATWNAAALGEDPYAIASATLANATSGSYESTEIFNAVEFEYAIDITEILRAWASYNKESNPNPNDNPAYGMMLWNTSGERYVDSVEASLSTTYVTMDTSVTGGEYYISHIEDGRFIKNTSTIGVRTYSDSNLGISWIVDYFGNGKYCIRNRRIPNQALYARTSEVTMIPIPEAGLTNEFLWEIQYAANIGAILKNVYSGLVLYLDHDEELNKDILKVDSQLDSTDENYYKTVWAIIKRSDYVSYTVLDVTNVEWMEIGETRSCALSFSPNNATWMTRDHFVWKSDNQEVATVSETGLVTAVGDGYTNIRVMYKHTRKVFIIPIVVGRLVPSGFYQICNVASDLYAEVENASMTEGTPIQQTILHMGDHAKWNIAYQGSGYYHIRSLDSNKLLAVSGGASESGAAIIQTSTISDACRWKICMTQNGNYKFISKSSGTQELVLSLPSDASVNGENLQQKAYTKDDSYIDEWVIDCERGASLIAIPANYDRSSFFAEANVDLIALGYSQNNYVKRACMNQNFVKKHMARSKVTVIRTHGAQTGIETSTEYWSINSISSLSNNYFSNSELIILGACNTGLGRETGENFVNALHAKGAQIVIGFEESVWNHEMNAWTKIFLDRLEKGASVEAAAVIATDQIEESWNPGPNNIQMGTDSFYIAGDDSTSFN